MRAFGVMRSSLSPAAVSVAADTDKHARAEARHASPYYQGLTLVAGCACAGGPIFAVKTRADGTVANFAEAYPNARAWLKKLAE